MGAPESRPQEPVRSGPLLWVVVLAVIVSFVVIPGVVLAITEFQWRSPSTVPALPFAVLTMVPGVLLGLVATLTMLPLTRTP